MILKIKYNIALLLQVNEKISQTSSLFETLFVRDV